MYVIILLQLLILFYLISHAYLFVKAITKNKKNLPSKSFRLNQSYSALIVASNEEQMIETAIVSILNQKQVHIEEIVIVVNNSKDKTFEIVNEFSRKDKSIKCINIDEKIGKSSATILGLSLIKNTYVFLLDVDTHLDDISFFDIAQFHELQNAEFTIGIINYKQQANWQSKIIEYERYFINHFLQTARGELGVATIHGSFSLVNKELYLKFQKDRILQDDLLVTYKLISEGYSVNITNKIVAEEEDRSSFKLFIFQRARWVVGNIRIFRIFISSLLRVKSLNRWLILSSYPFLWYIIYYALILGYLFSIFSGSAILVSTLILHVSYILVTYFASTFKSEHKISKLFWSILHSIIFPILITIATMVAILITVFNINVQDRLFFKRS